MTKDFEPLIIGFTCNWCSYRAADMAGTARLKYPANVRLGTLDVFRSFGPNVCTQGDFWRR